MVPRIRAAVIAALSVTLVTCGPSAGPVAEPELPDLGMAPLADLHVTSTPDGRQLLRFSATIVNVGAGPLQLLASRSSDTSEFRITQRVAAADGAHSDVPVDGELVFGGDGHSHWHVKDLETYELQRLDAGARVGTGSKVGFCFFDGEPHRLSLPGAPRSEKFDRRGCGDRSSLEVSMGVSVGWGDPYAWTLPDQYIDITGLNTGRYRLIATADLEGRFQETATRNNETWVEITLANRDGQLSLAVLDFGPAA